MLYKNGTSIYSPYPRPSPGTNNSTLIIFIEHRTELVILRRVRHVLTARRPSSRTTGVPFFKTQSLNIIHTNPLLLLLCTNGIPWKPYRALLAHTHDLSSQRSDCARPLVTFAIRAKKGGKRKKRRKNTQEYSSLILI